MCLSLHLVPSLLHHCLSIPLFIFLSVRPSICPSLIYPSIYTALYLCLSIHPPVCLLSICLDRWRDRDPSIYLYVYLSIYPFCLCPIIYPLISQSVCHPFYPSLHPVSSCFLSACGDSDQPEVKLVAAPPAGLFSLFLLALFHICER